MSRIPLLLSAVFTLLQSSPSGQARDAREPARSAKEIELADSEWIEGRVVFPPGTPADEELFVVAQGRVGTDDSSPRLRVSRSEGGDGVFRVAFSAGRNRGRLDLEGHYLYLPEAALWERRGGQPIVLEPRLGARILGHVRLPPGEAPTACELVLRKTGRSEISGRPASAQRATPNGLDFTFDALEPGEGTEWSYALVLDGERLVARSSRLVPAAGRTLEVELEAVPGVCLAGRLVDEDGRPLEGRIEAHVEPPGNATAGSADPAFDADRGAVDRLRRTESAPDGAFRLRALGAGAVRLTATADGFLPGTLDLGPLALGQTREDLELELVRGRSIAGRVHGADGGPTKATLVAVPLVVRPGEVPVPVTAASDGKGAFRIQGLPSGTYRVTAQAIRTEELLVKNESTGETQRQAKRVSLWAEEQPVEAGTSDLALTLASGLEIRGRVVDERGSPLEKGLLLARSLRPEASLPGWDGNRTGGLDDDDGRFTLGDLFPGEWELVARVKGHADSAPVRVTLPGTEPVVLVAPRGARVGGLVLDPSGHPVAKASLELDGEATPSRLTAPKRETDGAGHFTLEGLPAGAFALRAHADGFAPAPPLALELASGEAREDLVLRLRHAGAVLGVVVDAKDRPWPGRILVHGEDFDANVETDHEGRFELRQVPSGELSLGVLTEDGLGFETRVTLAAGETARVRLAPPGETVRLFGRVRAEGEPLAGAELSATRREPSAKWLDLPSFRPHRTDAEGAYELPLPGPGRYELGIQGPGESSFGWRVDVEVPALEAFELDVTIPVGRISGRLTEAGGAPLAGFRVFSEPEQHEGREHGFARTFTDAEGRFELVVPAGRHAVVAGTHASRPDREEASRFAEVRRGGLVVRAGDHLSGVDLVLGEGGTLAGLARRTDGSGALVELWSEDATGVHGLGSSDDSGRFELRGLKPGRHLVGARGETLATEEPVPVEIVAGETARLELTLVPARRVHFRIREDGQAVGSELSLRDALGRRLPIDTRENGEAWAGPLVPGRYTVRAERDVEHVERAFELTEGPEELVLELVFE